MKDDLKFIELPNGVELFPQATKEQFQSYAKNFDIVTNVIRDKGFSMSGGAETADTINDVIDSFTNLVLLAGKGYCKINFEVFNKYKDNSEVKFSDIKNIMDNSLRKVRKFEQEYSKSFQ